MTLNDQWPRLNTSSMTLNFTFYNNTALGTFLIWRYKLSALHFLLSQDMMYPGIWSNGLQMRKDQNDGELLMLTYRSWSVPDTALLLFLYHLYVVERYMTEMSWNYAEVRYDATLTYKTVRNLLSCRNQSQFHPLSKNRMKYCTLRWHLNLRQTINQTALN